MSSKLLKSLLVVLLSLNCGQLAAEINIEYEASSADAFPADIRALILEIAEMTEMEVRALLPELPEEVVVTVSSGRNVIPEVGVGASSVSPGHIEWVVDTSRSEGTEAIVRAHLRSTLFHELHHLARGWVISEAESVTSFMDAVVSEGLATAFEKEFADSEPLWGDYPENVDEWVDELTQLPLTAFDAYGAWMFMHPDGRRWIGYRAGTYVAEQAMELTGKTSADLVRTPTQEIVSIVVDR